MFEKKYTEEDYARALEIYKSGVSISETSRQTGISFSQLSRRLGEQGVKRPNDRAEYVTGRMRNEMRRLYGQGMSKREIAESLKVKLCVVEHHTRCMDSTPHHKRGLQHHNSKPQEVMDRMLELAKLHVPTADICKELHVSRTWVYRHCRLKGVPLRRKLSVAEINSICRRRRSGEPLTDIGRDYDLSGKTIGNVCRRNKGRLELDEQRQKVLQAYLLGDDVGYASERLGIPRQTLKKLYASFREDGIYQQE